MVAHAIVQVVRTKEGACRDEGDAERASHEHEGDGLVAVVLVLQLAGIHGVLDGAGAERPGDIAGAHAVHAAGEEHLRRLWADRAADDLEVLLALADDLVAEAKGDGGVPGIDGVAVVDEAGDRLGFGHELNFGHEENLAAMGGMRDGRCNYVILAQVGISVGGASMSPATEVVPQPLVPLTLPGGPDQSRYVESFAALDSREPALAKAGARMTPVALGGCATGRYGRRCSNRWLTDATATRFALGWKFPSC